ncbi:sodium-coupled monocarboxylate transporter 1-like [Physella acuta]|uniref:sodium-coupled monocarboxylate transporter 1-like n=1 Tax=Physella acuta TaxID=109671 RepID=UPI0027DEA2FE|nr:sodium-coupled monocarboxylate transporter 1-like [Physella acuta]
MDHNVSLQTADYVVTTLMLVVPLAIGIFYAVKDYNKATRDQYLLGGRQMSMLPVAISIFVTFASAISLVGVPADVYFHGPMIPIFQLGFAIGYLLGVVTMVPLIYPLHLTSIYEYLEMRFDSSFVRRFTVIIGMLQTMLYMAMALLTPALALQTAAGIPLEVSVLIVGVTGTVYTTLGGIKSVVWTDVFQCVVMYAGIFIMLIKGVMLVGGVDVTLQIAKDGGRTSFMAFSPDPRTRHTWWGTTIGGAFMWLGNIFNQSTTQRVCSVKTMTAARISLIINAIVTVVYGVLLLLVGIVIFSYFSHIQCDPYEAGLITNKNRIPAYFVLHSLQDLPGMAGIYMSTLFSGCLSTLSSGINTLAAVTVEDILKKPLERFSESKATMITKIIACVYGVIIIGLAYLADQVKGSIAQTAMTVSGACSSPIVGIFLLGATVPWANKYGTLSGGVIGITVNIWISLANLLYGRKAAALPSASTEMCFQNITTLHNITTNIMNSTSLTNIYPYFNNMFTLSNGTQNITDFGINDNKNFTKNVTDFDISETNVFLHFIYNLSYEWYGVIGIIITYCSGLVISYCTRHYVQNQINRELIFPFVRKFWNLPKIHRKETDEENFQVVEKKKVPKKLLENYKETKLSINLGTN